MRGDSLRILLQIPDDRVTELRAFYLFGAIHEPRKIIGHGLRPDGAIHAFDNEIGGLKPAEVAKHHGPERNEGRPPLRTSAGAR